MMRITAQPGWKWSNDVKPHVGTESCQTNHLGYIAEGTICVRMDDGTEASYTKGQAYSITPGHDAWVVGNETAVATAVSFPTTQASCPGVIEYACPFV